jgi:hypothetical protein
MSLKKLFEVLNEPEGLDEGFDRGCEIRAREIQKEEKIRNQTEMDNWGFRYNANRKLRKAPTKDGDFILV